MVIIKSPLILLRALCLDALPKFKKVMKMIVLSLDMENTVGSTANYFFCI